MKTISQHDDDEWEEEPAEVHVRPSATEVVSFRLAGDDLDRLQSAARDRGASLSEFIRGAIEHELDGRIRQWNAKLREWEQPGRAARPMEARRITQKRPNNHNERGSEMAEYVQVCKSWYDLEKNYPRGKADYPEFGLFVYEEFTDIHYAWVCNAWRKVPFMKPEPKTLSDDPPWHREPTDDKPGIVLTKDFPLNRWEWRYVGTKTWNPSCRKPRTSAVEARRIEPEPEPEPVTVMLKDLESVIDYLTDTNSILNRWGVLDRFRAAIKQAQR